jgi:hypothetical protein
VRERDDWLVLLPDQLPAYISVEQYERNLAQLKANQARAGEIGAVRDGAALPVGLVACGRCGRRMTVRYRRLQRPAYVCATEAASYGGRLCQHLASPCVDRFVTAQVLAALAPAALELSLAAAAQLERDRASLDRLWQQRLERAGYQAQRARRQYQLAEPEHRLVARQLERAWEDTLAAQQQLRQAYRRFATTQPRTLSADQRAAIGRLAADIPALWDASTTSDADRKQLIRQVVERVTVTIDGDSEQVTVTIQWAGGARTRGELVRPVARLEQLSYWPKLAARARELAAAGLHAATIAQRLGAEGYRPPKRHERFGPQGVQDLLHRVGARQPQPRPHKQGSLGEHEWWLVDLARALGMPPTTLRTWADRGWVTARQQPQPPRRWVIWADEAELQQLRQRRGRPAGYYTRRRWVQEEPEPTPRRGE